MLLQQFQRQLEQFGRQLHQLHRQIQLQIQQFLGEDASRSAQYWTRQHITLGHTFRARQLAACAEDVMPPGTQLPLVWHQPSPLLTSRHLWDSNPRGKKRATLHDFTVIQNSDEPWFLLFPDLFRQFHGFFCLNIGHPIPSAKKKLIFPRSTCHFCGQSPMGTFRPQTLVWMNHNDLTMSLE